MAFLRGSLFKFCRVQRNEVASRICNDCTEKSCRLSENVIDHSCLKDGEFSLFISSFLPFYIFFCPQDWFAFTGNGSQLNFTITGKEYFANSGNPSAQNNYGFCQVKTTLFQHLAQLCLRLKLSTNLSNSNSFNKAISVGCFHPTVRTYFACFLSYINSDE